MTKRRRQIMIHMMIQETSRTEDERVDATDVLGVVRQGRRSGAPVPDPSDSGASIRGERSR